MSEVQYEMKVLHVKDAKKAAFIQFYACYLLEAYVILKSLHTQKYDLNNNNLLPLYFILFEVFSCIEWCLLNIETME